MISRNVSCRIFQARAEVEGGAPEMPFTGGASRLGLPLYCKVRVDYYYHCNIQRGPFYTLHYSHVTH